MRILVTGAAGFIGTAICERLMSVGLQVTGVDRRPTGAAESLDLLETERLQGLLQGIDLVVHLAGVGKEPGFADEVYRRDNLEATRSLLSCMTAAGTDRLIFTSSMSVFGFMEAPTFEDAPFAPDTAYGLSKAGAEEACRTWEREKPARQVAILRPAAVFGPGDSGNFDRLRRAAMMGWFARPSGPPAMKAGIHVQEIVGLIEYLLLQDFRELTINVAYEPVFSVDEWIRAMGHAYGRKVRIVTLPLTLLRGLFAIGHSLERKKPVHTRTFHSRRLDKVRFSTYLASRNISELNFKYAFSPNEAVKHWITEVGAGSPPLKDQSPL